MLHPDLLQTLARDRQRQLLDAAERSHRTSAHRAAHRRPIRARAGWWLVERGMRLVATDHARHHAAPLALRGLGR
jgi:hypothetical protein